MARTRKPDALDAAIADLTEQIVAANARAAALTDARDVLLARKGFDTPATTRPAKTRKPTPLDKVAS